LAAVCLEVWVEAKTAAANKTSAKAHKLKEVFI